MSENKVALFSNLKGTLFSKKNEQAMLFPSFSQNDKHNVCRTFLKENAVGCSILLVRKNVRKQGGIIFEF